ncbi:CotH kinase family protein [Spongisporangium articulatum]|uniref:CotH kinase family protein n=1 Tax=Spongisporangium articulatum TaxID=3362603 RepID=A0ABW8AR23_9ACTN
MSRGPKQHPGKGRRVRRAAWAATAVAALLTALVVPGWSTAQAAAAPGSVLISEVDWTDWAGALDSEGDRSDWVELAAPGSAVDVSGFGLSNKTNSPYRWRLPQGTTVPAGGYLLVWLSGKDRVLGGQPHASFDIDGGDPVLLTAPDGTQLDSVTTPKAGKRDTSWCRATPSLAAAWQYCAAPTAGAANSGAMSATLLAAPTLSQPGGLYDAPFTVSATGPAGATLRYTIDGSEPTAASPVMPAGLAMKTSGSLRVAAFATGAISSPVTTASYVVGSGVTTARAGQRVVLVTMSPADAAAQAAGTKDAKWAAAVQMIGPDGKSLFAADAETDVPGQSGSTGVLEKGLDVSFKSALGTKSVSAQLIPGRPATSYKKFRLRNGSNDFYGTRLRDSVAGELAYGGPNLGNGMVPVATYVNGAYYGLMELREKDDETAVERYTGADKDDVDYVSDPAYSTQDVKNGEDAAAHYAAMRRLVVGKDLTVPANYQAAVAQLNPVSLAHDWVLHLWALNWDWPGKNVNVWRAPTVDGGRWQWQPHDFDTSQGNTGVVGASISAPQLNNVAAFAGPGNDIIGPLLKNPTFKAVFLNAAADELNTRLTSAHATAVLDQQAAAMKPYVAENAKRWLGAPSLMAWQSNVSGQRSWLAQRSPWFDGWVRSYFGVSARQPLTVSVNDTSAGSVQVNSVDLGPLVTAAKPSWTGGYYPQAPVTLTATPKPGQVFLRWAGASTSTARVLTLPVTKATAVKAVFGPAAGPQIPVITPVADRRDVVGDVVTLPLKATDASGLPITWSAKKLPSGVDVYAKDGVIYGRLTKPEVDTVTLTADNGASPATATFTWTVVNP